MGQGDARRACLGLLSPRAAVLAVRRPLGECQTRSSFIRPWSWARNNARDKMQTPSSRKGGCLSTTFGVCSVGAGLGWDMDDASACPGRMGEGDLRGSGMSLWRQVAPSGTLQDTPGLSGLHCVLSESPGVLSFWSFSKWGVPMLSPAVPLLCCWRPHGWCLVALVPAQWPPARRGRC